MELLITLLNLFVLIKAQLRLSQDFIDEINQRATTWRAGTNFHSETPIEEVINLIGVHPDSSNYELPSIIDIDYYNDNNINIPATFDSRDKWPKCPSIGQIRDQGACGSCWAFGAVEAMSDRYCIHSNATKHFIFSAEELMTCCQSCGYGCDGGIPGAAWDYWVNNGIVSGGSFGSKLGCQPYKTRPCSHHTSGKRKSCTLENAITPVCSKKCQPNYKISYEKDKIFGKSAYSIYPDSTAIQREIIQSGPVEAAFDVYEDFLHYKSGVYQNVHGAYLGGHAVKILGWGVEGNTPYWLIANSWNSDWGEKGFFKMLRGEDHLGIEDSVCAGLPKYD